MMDSFGAYMQGNPEITFHDTPIDRFSAEAFAPFADESGALTRNLDVTVFLREGECR